MKRWRLKKLVDGQWYTEGVYGERFIEQMGAAVAMLTMAGFRMYETMRIEEVPERQAEADA